MKILPIFHFYLGDEQVYEIPLTEAVENIEVYYELERPTADLLSEGEVIKTPFAYYGKDKKVINRLFKTTEIVKERKPMRRRSKKRTKKDWDENFKKWADGINKEGTRPPIYIGKEPKAEVTKKFGLNPPVKNIPAKKYRTINALPHKLSGDRLEPLRRVKMIRKKFYKKGVLIKFINKENKMERASQKIYTLICKKAGKWDQKTIPIPIKYTKHFRSKIKAIKHAETEHGKAIDWIEEINDELSSGNLDLYIIEPLKIEK